MNVVSETKTEGSNVLSFEDWSAKVRAAAAAEQSRIQSEKDEFARRATLFEAFRL